MTKRHNKYMKRSHSKAPLKTFSMGKEFPNIFPDFNFDAALALVETDTVASGAVTHYVDKAMEGDYSIIRRENREYDRLAELLLEEKYMFRTKILRKIYLIGKLFNNVFVEIVRDSDGKTKSLNILDSTNIDAIVEPNGDPISYESKVPNPATGEKATWDKGDITWIKFGDRTAGYAPVDIKALWSNLNMKRYILRYNAWLWKTGQYRLMYTFKNASTGDINDFITMAKRNDDRFDIPYIIKGEVDTKILRDMKEVDSLINILKYIDSQTLILLRIPPIDAGIPDASGRSNADAQSNNIESTISSAKKLVADYINFDLFPKIHKSTVMLVYGPMNRFAVKQLLEQAKMMKDMMMTDEAIEEFLNDNGLFFKATMFKEPELNPLDAAFKPKNTVDAKGTGEGNKPQDEVTTREDQLKKV